jgi:hypothetical protein
MERKLLPHQEVQFNVLQEYKNKGHLPSKVGLWFKAGAGKTEFTLQTIKKLYNPNLKILVLMPASFLKDNEWKGCSTFSIPSLRGNAMENFLKKKFKLPSKYRTFEEVLNLFLHLEMGLKTGEEFILVVDEVHKDGLREYLPTKAGEDRTERIRFRLKRLITKARYSFLLTGTPGGKGDYDYWNVTRLLLDTATDLGKKDINFLFSLNKERLKEAFSEGELKNIKLWVSRLVPCPYEKLSPQDDFEAELVGMYATNPDMGIFNKEKVPFSKYTEIINYTNYKKDFKVKVESLLDNLCCILKIGEEDISKEIVDYSNFTDTLVKVPITLLPEDSEFIEKPQQTKRAFLNEKYLNFKVEKVIEILEKHPKEMVIVWSAHRKSFEKTGQYLELISALEQYKILPYSPENLLLFREKKIRGLLAKVKADKEGHTWTEATINIYTAPVDEAVGFAQSRHRILRVGQKKEVHNYLLYFEVHTEAYFDDIISSELSVFSEKKYVDNMIKRYKKNEDRLRN